MSTGRRQAVKMGKIFGIFAAVIFIALGMYFLPCGYSFIF